MQGMDQVVSRAAAAFGIADEDAVVDQAGDVVQGGVLGAFGELGPLRRGESAAEVIHETVEKTTPTVIEGDTLDAFPEPRLGEHRRESRLRPVDSSAHVGQEPDHPHRDICATGIRYMEWLSARAGT